MNKKRILASALSYSGAIRFFRLMAKHFLIVVNYHRVKANNWQGTYFDDGVFDTTTAQLTAHIKWLKANTKVLTEDELINLIESANFPARICSLITFDDGYRDNYTIAYPILKGLDIPAIFFIPTQQIMSRQLGWWDLISYLIKTTKKTMICFEDTSFALPSQQEEAIRFFLQKMKLEKASLTKTLVKRLAEICDTTLPGHHKQDAELMTWDQVRDVSQNNISIGSHSHTHRVLATLDTSVQNEELTLSRQILEKETGNIVRSISYPVGYYNHFTAETQKIAEQCGYKLGFSYNTGVNMGYSISKFNVKRVGVPCDLNVLECTTFLPQIFAKITDNSTYNR